MDKQVVIRESYNGNEIIIKDDKGVEYVIQNSKLVVKEDQK